MTLNNTRRLLITRSELVSLLIDGKPSSAVLKGGAYIVLNKVSDHCIVGEKHTFSCIAKIAGEPEFVAKVEISIMDETPIAGTLDYVPDILSTIMVHAFTASE